MTEKYAHDENANGILKEELNTTRNTESLDIKKRIIKSSIDNNRRSHLSNQMLTIMEMHKQNKNIQNKKAEQ